MPDVMIPGAVVVTIGVIFCAAHAFFSGDYKTSAVAGVIGTVFNLLGFMRRLSIQVKAQQLRAKRQK